MTIEWWAPLRRGLKMSEEASTFGGFLAHLFAKNQCWHRVSVRVSTSLVEVVEVVVVVDEVRKK